MTRILDQSLVGIVPAEKYLAIRCGEASPILGSEAESARTIQQAVAAKMEMIVFAVDGTEERDGWAGRADTGPQLSDIGYERLASHIEIFAEMAAIHGISSSFHPYAETYVESERDGFVNG